MAQCSANWRPLAVVAASLATACSDTDETTFVGPDIPGVRQGVPAFMGFPERAEDWAEAPALLSQTEGFTELVALGSSPGLLPYDVQSALYSDGATKRRWLALPSETQIGFSEEGAWTFPEGTVLVKQFDMALDERRPQETRRMETRFLVAAKGGGFYGLVYRWNEAQTEAELIGDGLDEQLQIVGEDGVVRDQTYTFPAQDDCPKCHSDIAGGALGPRTAQLNGDFPYPGQSTDAPRLANQLSTWERFGLFDRVIGDRPLSEYPQLAGLGDESKPVEQRVRSYWESNCSMCHNADSPVPSWDARYETELERQGVLDAESYAGPRSDGLLLIASGDPERSAMVARVATDEPLMRMPPLLRNRVDHEFVQLLSGWIASLRSRQ